MRTVFGLYLDESDVTDINDPLNSFKGSTTMLSTNDVIIFKDKVIKNRFGPIGEIKSNQTYNYKIPRFGSMDSAFIYVRSYFAKKNLGVGNKGISKTVYVNGEKYRIMKTGNYTGNLSAYRVK